jgi:hypothetical protein
LYSRLRSSNKARRFLDEASTVSLVHAFLASRVGYCSSLLTVSPKVFDDKLQRVLDAVTRVVTNYDHGMSDIVRNQLHWLDVTERIKHRVAVSVFREEWFYSKEQQQT